MSRITHVVIPDERPQSWNKTYAGQHWAKRKAEVERVRLALRAALDPDQCVVYTEPVDIEIIVCFNARPLDADNIPAKLYIDALKGWLLEDDDRRCVRSVKTVALVDPARPRVEIEIVPVGVFVTPRHVLAGVSNPPFAWD